MLSRLLAVVWMLSLAGFVRGDVTVSAAISLKAPLEKVRPELENAAGGKINFTYGASGTLAAQIRKGAPVDLFISADQLNVTKLKDEKLLDNGTIAAIVSNELVLVVPKNGANLIHSFSDLMNGSTKHVAMGDPQVVPAGTYAKQTLTWLKLYDALNGAGKLVTGENVAQVLAFVNRGEVDAGLVYRTDAMQGENVSVVAVAPAESHVPIVYVMAVPSGAVNAAAAKGVEGALLGNECQKAFAGFGFSRAGQAGVNSDAASRPAGAVPRR